VSLFSVPKRAGRAESIALAKKSGRKGSQSSTTVRGATGILDRLNMARSLVEKAFGHYRDKFIMIQDQETLDKYIDAAIKFGEMAIDTETTGLDLMNDTIVGICLYVPGLAPAYLPLGHRSYITGAIVAQQLPQNAATQAVSRLHASSVRLIMFNAVFDIRVIEKATGIRLKCYWDCSLGARLLNENEDFNTRSLDALHKKYCTDGSQKSMDYGDIFKDIPFDLVPLSMAYLYAANDALITYELYQFQKPFLTPDDPLCIERGLVDVAWVFHNIEMPIVDVVVAMETRGVKFDFEYNEKLQKEYHAKLEEQKKVVYSLIAMYEDEINTYRLKNPGVKLEDPINISSTTQLAILLYDIIGEDPVMDKKTKKPTRSTSEDVLTSIGTPLCKEILKYRSLSVLVSTFIDKMPKCVAHDGRVHCNFNQYGADTGRFSSSNPNLQNIPSHNKDIRKMFTASDGYVLLSADYSQQEPRCLAALCKQQGDPQMYNTFMSGKDLYSAVASAAFKVPYEDCHAKRPDGTDNPAGKTRRDSAKTILLGTLYGRGVDSIAEQLNTTRAEAQKIQDAVFAGFPAIKQFEQDSIKMAQTHGFVTTVCGRKRRLPSMMLPDYEVVWKDGVAPDEDPLDFSESEVITEVPESIQAKWIRKVKNAPFFSKRKVFEEANAAGLRIIDNTRSKDITKVVNARIQGKPNRLNCPYLLNCITHRCA
jgi:DNA polymerase-1